MAGILVLLIAPKIFALCQLETDIEGDKLINLVYGENGLRTGSQLGNVSSPNTITVERNEVVITDENGTSYVVEETPTEAVDLSTSNTFIENKTAKGGPFFVSCILDDTLRIAKGKAYDFGYGTKLHERFEGRTETLNLVEAVGNELAVFFQGIVQALQTTPRVRNVIRAEDFTANAICASSVCEKDMYSLFMRYLNVGGSTQMFLEFFGSGIYRYALPTGVKMKLQKFTNKILFKVEAFVHGGMDKYLQHIYNELDEETKFVVSKFLRGEGGPDLLEKLSLSQRRKAFAFLNVFDQYADDVASKAKEVADLADPDRLARELLENPDDVVKRLDDLEKSLKNTEDVVGGKLFYTKTADGAVLADDVAVKVKAVKEGIEGMKETTRQLVRAHIQNYADLVDDIYKTNPDALARALRKVDPRKVKNNYIKFVLEEFKEGRITVDDLRKVLKRGFWQSFLKDPAVQDALLKDPDIYKMALRKLDDATKQQILRELKSVLSDSKEYKAVLQALPDIAELKYMKTGVERGRYVLTKQLPVTATFADKVRDWTAEWRPKNPLVREWVVDLPLFYFLRGGTFTAPPPWGGKAFFGVFPSGFGVVRRPATIPPEWKVIKFLPPKGSEFGDSFVDVLANHGVDPGDLFRAIVTYSAAGVASKVFELTGKPLPLADAMFSTEHEQRRREMKSAIFAIALNDPQCPDCSLSIKDNHIVFSAPEAGGGIFVTENSKKEDGSNIILFAHHLNIDMGDAEIDLDEAKKEGKDCESACPIVAGIRNITFGVVNDPRGAMFLYATMTSIVYASPVGLWFMPVDMLLSTKLIDPCFQCVDTTGGYYIHIFAPHVEEDVALGEGEVEEAISNVVEKILPDNNLLREKVEQLKGYLKQEEIKKENVVFQAFLKNVGGELHTPYIISLWTKAKELVPVSYSTEGSVEINTPDGPITVDTEQGTISFNGEDVLSDPDRVRMYSIDLKVPGILIPAFLLRTSFSPGLAFEASSSKDYRFNDEGFISCISEYFGDVYTTFGDLVEVHTSKGVIRFREDDVEASLDDWSGKVNIVDVYGDYSVRLVAPDFVVEENTLTWGTKEVDAGELESIIFQRAVVLRKDNELLVWVKYISMAPREAVASVNVSPGEKGIKLELTPRPDVPEEVANAVKQISEGLEKVGDIRAIKSEEGTIAFADGPEGLEMRVYDKNGNIISRELVKNIYRDPTDPTKVIVETNAGRHELQINLSQDGTPHLSMDGKDMGIPQVFQGEKGFLWYDPTTGEWRLINGALLPLAEAFKNGIRVALEGGNLVGSPSGGSYVLEGKKERGMALPFGDIYTLITLLVVFLLIQQVRGRKT